MFLCVSGIHRRAVLGSNTDMATLMERVVSLSNCQKYFWKSSWPFMPAQSPTRSSSVPLLPFQQLRVPGSRLHSNPPFYKAVNLSLHWGCWIPHAHFKFFKYKQKPCFHFVLCTLGSCLILCLYLFSFFKKTDAAALQYHHDIQDIYILCAAVWILNRVCTVYKCLCRWWCL